MHRASLPVRISALFAAVVMFVLAAGGAAALADDYLAREVLAEGSNVAGVDISGLTRAEARSLVEEQVARPLSEPVTVTHQEHSFTLDAGSMIAIDVDGMVDAAFAPKRDNSLAGRVADRALGRAIGGNAEVLLTLDKAKIAGWLDAVAGSIDTTPADATMTVETDAVVIVNSRIGETVDREGTTAAIEAALAAGDKQVEMAVDYTEPDVTDDELGPAIFVDISERRLVLYDKGLLVKEYGIAVGMPGFPTPRGNFQIVLKRYMPTWSNPGSAWAAGMPATIPPGPSNPLGTRALNLDAPGIRIHGTNKDSSIGTAASHGCMRMHRWDVEDLYERVEVGTPVFIVR